jgi:hypothetical protein
MSLSHSAPGGSAHATIPSRRCHERQKMGNSPWKHARGQGMLVEKPGPRSALGVGSEPGQGQGPGSTVPPHGAPGLRFTSGRARRPTRKKPHQWTVKPHRTGLVFHRVGRRGTHWPRRSLRPLGSRPEDAANRQERRIWNSWDVATFLPGPRGGSGPSPALDPPVELGGRANSAAGFESCRSAGAGRPRRSAKPAATRRILRPGVPARSCRIRACPGAVTLSRH